MRAVAERRFTELLILFFLLLMMGCATPIKSASTTVLYKVTKDGKEVSYTSDKEQIGFSAEYEGDDQGNPKKVKISADRAGTQESVLAAQVKALEIQSALIQKLVEQMMAAKAAGS